MKAFSQSPYLSVIPLTLVLFISYLFVSTSVLANGVNDDLEKRLKLLSQALEKQRIEQHIPGMAMAIVKDGQVIFSQGFGLANLAEKTPVTEQSIFAIGSTSKAFTATIAGMLVDQDKMQWDSKLTDYLPYYQFIQKGSPINITIRDALSHRSGYARNDILWVNGKVSREDILKDATKAEKWAPFGKQFHYNNVMFLAAGMATAKQAKVDWNTQLQNRLFTPLNMLNSSIGLAKAKQSPHLATGYMWRDVIAEHQAMPMRDLTNIAPAGAINSNIIDMSNWLKFQLANGKFAGKQLVSKESLLETRKPQIQISKDIYYGLGWMLHQWQGQSVVEHGGNIDGYSAQVTLFPESNLGYVLLTNITATPLQQLSINLVASYLLAPQKVKQQATKTANLYDFRPLVGEYLANFGPFRDTIFTVQVKDGKLAVDVPGQTLYILKQPNAQGKWMFEITDTIAVSFDKNQQGQISALRMHQNGMDFELPKKGVIITPEISPTELQKYLGSYYSKQLNSNSKTIIQNHRLAIDVPGQMVYELNLPNEDGEWTFRINPNMHVVFDENADNQITHLHFYKNGKQNGTMPRVKEKNQLALPSVNEILALRKTKSRKEALIKARGISTEGSIFFAQAGITGKVEAFSKSDTHSRVNIDLDKYGLIETSISPESAETKQSFSPFVRLHGKYLKQAQKGFPMADVDWHTFYDNIEVVKQTEFANKTVYMVLLKNTDLPTVTAYIDSQNGDTLKIETTMMVQGIGSMPYSLVFEDYREIDGLRLPFKVTSRDNQRGKLVIQTDTIKTGLVLDDAIFRLTE